MVGQIIRTIRKDKNIKSSFVYRGILSRTASSKFERGICDTTTEKFFMILERLNITLEEFNYLLKRQEDKDFLIVNNYISAFYTNDLEKLYQLRDKTLEEFNNSKIKKFLHYHAVISLLINLKCNEELEVDKLEIIKNYLLECDNWGYYEIVLFTNTMEFYSQDFIDIVYKRCKSYLLDFKGSKRYKNEQIIFILNILEISVSKLDIKRTHYYLEEFKELSPFLLDNIYFKTMGKFFSNILLIIKCENVENAKNEIQVILNFLSFLDMGKQLLDCKNLYETIEAKIQLERT